MDTIHKLYQYPLAGIWHLEHCAIVTIQRYSMKIQFSTSTKLASGYFDGATEDGSPCPFSSPSLATGILHT